MISKFINREEELKYLELEWRNTPSLVIIYGIRRIGKTRLIEKFIEGKPAFKYTFPDANKKIQLNEFKEKMSRYFNEPLILKIETDSWHDILSLLSDKITGKTCIVLDEFTYAIKSDGKIVSDIQRVWDEKLSKKNVMLILCGSLLGLMKKKVLSKTSPLYGRRTRDLLIQELSFLDSTKFFRNFNYAVEAYLLVGGIPEYLLVARKHSTIKQLVEQEFLNRNGYFYREPYFLLFQQVKEFKTYFSILQAIAFGNTKPTEIANFTGMETRKIFPYLETLMEIGVIKRETPVIGKEKRGVYKLKNKAVNTWFNIVYKNREEIERGTAIFNQNQVNTLLGREFEEACIELVGKNLQLPFKPEKTGRWWLKDLEIDVVALNQKERKIAFIEVKWKEVNEKEALKILRDLEEKAKKVSWNLNNRKEYYGIITKRASSSTKEKLVEKEYLIWDLKDIKKLR
ncbi:MAG: ATP-binding protein [Thermoprotei archaeon]|nr:MAG: ATP-binding protein [Thermoprotei archaeon]